MSGEEHTGEEPELELGASEEQLEVDDAPEPDEAPELDDAPEPDEADDAPLVDDAPEADPEPDEGPADAEPSELASESEPELIVEPWEPPVRRHRGVARLIGVAALAVPTIIAGSVMLQASGLKDDAGIDERLVGALRYDGDGDPLVRAPNVNVGTVQRREWRVCGKSCDKISGRGKEFRPGEVLAGSRIRVRVVGSAGEATIETPGWDGRLDALRRPILNGTPQVGSPVSARRGKWTGGWLGGQTLIGVRACPTKQGGGRCVAFTSSILNPDGATEHTVPAAFRGWWIGAIEWHVPPGRSFEAAPESLPSGPATPQDGTRAPTAGHTVATGPLRGPIR